MGTLKQYETLGDRRVLDWAVDGARSAADGVVLVVPHDRLDADEPGVDVVVAGGSTRSESVRLGLASVPEAAEVVVVHDAARPLAPLSLFAAVVAAVDGTGAAGAIPAIPVNDTVKRAHEGRVVATIERAGLVAVQTPQAFVAAVLRRAHATGGDATDDAALVEATGAVVAVVPGDPGNRKLTTAADLSWARSIVAAADSAAGSS